MADDRADQPQFEFYKNFPTFFSKTVNIIDNNIRIIQYTVYSVGAFGLFYSLHSIRAFSRFKRIEDIPKDFLRKNIKLYGTVQLVSTKPPHFKFQSANGIELYGTQLYVSGNREVNAEDVGRVEKSQTTEAMRDDGWLVKQRLASRLPDISEDELYATAPLYLKVCHIPIIQLKRSEAAKSNDGLPVKLAAVQVKESYITKISEDLLGRKVSFRILAHDADDDTLTSIVKPASMYSESYSATLVLKGWAQVDAYDRTLGHINRYTRLYKKLIKIEEKRDRKPSWLWTVLQKIFTRKK